MDEFVRFLGVMSALSASAQTMTYQLRKRFNWLRLDEEDADGLPVAGQEPEAVQKSVARSRLLKIKQGKLHANVHLVCGVNGFLLATAANIHPLQLLGLHPIWAHARPPMLAHGLDFVCAGVLVAYGGPWFHEVLGILREYKKSLRGTA